MKCEKNLTCSVMIGYCVIDSGVDQNLQIKFISLFECFKNCDIHDMRWLTQKIIRNDYKWHIRNIHIKYEVIIVFQYTIAEYVAFFVQYH